MSLKKAKLFDAILFLLVFVAIGMYIVHVSNKYDAVKQDSYYSGVFSGCVAALAPDISDVIYKPVPNLEKTCRAVVDHIQNEGWYEWDAR